jgi:hypothetical protein
MKIEVTQLPETKLWTDRYKQYTMTFPNGYPVPVRRPNATPTISKVEAQHINYQKKHGRAWNE